MAIQRRWLSKRAPARRGGGGVGGWQLILVLLLHGLATGLTAAELPPIWDATVLPQPFEPAPFQRVHIPDWVWDTVGNGYTLSAQDTAQRTRAAQAGVTVSELGFVDPFYAYYDSQLLRRR